jgi:hypothetical protein
MPATGEESDMRKRTADEQYSRNVADSRGKCKVYFDGAAV